MTDLDGYAKEMERHVAELPRGLYLLDLPQPRTGFRYFISSWFFIDDLGRKILVDPGPASTIPLLFEKLSSITDSVDLVLLTHIHLDHAGGIGHFCERCGNAKVLVCPRAVKHLLNPEKLWKASLATLGDLPEMYGAPLPLRPEALSDGKLPGIDVFETPGHAPHHISFIVPFQGEKLIFVGEAAGLSLPPLFPDSSPYLRPTTPPKFDAAAAQASLEKIEERLQDSEILCYAHWGATRSSRARVALARRQICDWLSLTSQMIGQTEEKIMERLLSSDPLLSGYSHLPEDLRAREEFFIKNSLKGVLEYSKLK